MAETTQSEILARLRALEDANRASKPPNIPLIDPTANVLKFVENEVKRLNDLRESDNSWSEKFQTSEERHHREISELQEKLRLAESNRLDAVNLAERNRIDANIAQGKADVALASEKAATTAVTLANSVVASAKALSDTVATTTATTVAQFAQLREYVDKQIGPLAQTRFEGAGATQKRSEDSQLTRWLIGLVIVVIMFLAGHFWK